MIQYESLFKISYGLYIVSAGDNTAGNAFVSNTVFQITAEPARFAASCNKDNYTSEFIKKHKAFAVSVLEQDTDATVMGHFGFKSGKNTDKLKGMDVLYGETGVPIIRNNALAYFEFKVSDQIDMGTHWLFIGDLISAGNIKEGAPLTYAYYRDNKRGFAPKNAPTYIDKSKLEKKAANLDKYKCSVCGYIHDENEDGRFDALDSGWKCPVCGADKDDFYKI